VTDWYERLRDDGLLDFLAPYTPVVVGSYPLGVAADWSRVEIACRTSNLGAFARTMQRGYGDRPGFGLYPGSLDGEEAVFAEFEADGVPVEVAAQREHVHRRLGAATLGVDRLLATSGAAARSRLAAAVAAGDDWLDAAMAQFDLTRSAIEALATANPALVRRMSGVRDPGPPLAAYVVPVVLGLTAQILIVVATVARDSTSLTGAMLILEGAVLGAIFGARIGIVAALVPLVLVGLVVGTSVLVGSESCSPECGTQIANATFVLVLVASAAGLTGAIRDRYFAR
jgi:hypothetical protein